MGSMGVLKLYAWEPSMEERITKQREVELKVLRASKASPMASSRLDIVRMIVPMTL